RVAAAAGPRRVPCGREVRRGRGAVRRVKTNAPASDWGRKAEALYQPSYAREYRRHDEGLDKVAAYEMFCSWLRDVSLSFGRTIDVLDLGCGTGRYFCAVSNVRTLVGFDASPAMLEE